MTSKLRLDGALKRFEAGLSK